MSRLTPLFEPVAHGAGHERHATERSTGRTSAATVLAEGKRRREEITSRVAPTDPRARLDFEEETIKLLEESHARLISSTQAYLSPQQVAVMRNSMANQVSMQKATLRARRAQVEAGAGPPESAAP